MENTYVQKIWIRTRFMVRGTHFYKEAGTDPRLATGDKYDVSYLASEHAHDFWFDVQVEVQHDNRHIEFIQFRQKLLDAYAEGSLDAGYKSCEMLARELILYIRQNFNMTGHIIVGVYEDSLLANGGIVEELGVQQ